MPKEVGRGSPKDLAKTHENVRMEWTKDAQRSGPRMIKGIKRAKEAQDSMRISPAEVLGNAS